MFQSRNDGQTRTIIFSLTSEFTPLFFLNPLCIYRVLQSLNYYFNARSLANQPTHFSTIFSWNLACGWLFLKSSDICSSPRPPRPKCSLTRPPRPKCSLPRPPRPKCSSPRPMTKTRCFMINIYQVGILMMFKLKSLNATRFKKVRRKII